ncbi:fluoride efflux transporter CrcB [Desulfocurvibacter africanus]|uniref:Fluoride-specific ion channel FluC n=2 Tax=Desulfocurvibacter africanus TaxID=873 RepID=F3Z1S0_DESAF|nr:fluoride efflux transporter CrcB [Desulfocurvibacter africanus]EGJ51205.1 CrcB-like protein [Desulfocurvibacter africanus subsp. africanus str. Walvis Bay]EMG38951.1 camphor resistance protein CrcB [Desulfocurvibacter africanus PCS]
MHKLVLMAMAGAAGTLARYGLAQAVQRLSGQGFPTGTFAVNVLGSFLFGLVWTLCEDRLPMGSEVRIVLLTGFMGAFTTFSTFMFESSALLKHGQWMYALLNIGGQTLLGLFALTLGIAAAKLRF